MTSLSPDTHAKVLEVTSFAAKAVRLLGSTFPPAEPWADAVGAILAAVSNAMRVQGKTVDEIVMSIHLPRSLVTSYRASDDARADRLPHEDETTDVFDAPTKKLPRLQ